MYYAFVAKYVSAFAKRSRKSLLGCCTIFMHSLVTYFLDFYILKFESVKKIQKVVAVVHSMDYIRTSICQGCVMFVVDFNYLCASAVKKQI